MISTTKSVGAESQVTQVSRRRRRLRKNPKVVAPRLAPARTRFRDRVGIISMTGVDEAERCRALLEINNSLISHLDRDDLFHAIARTLRIANSADSWRRARKSSARGTKNRGHRADSLSTGRHASQWTRSTPFLHPDSSPSSRLDEFRVVFERSPSAR